MRKNIFVLTIILLIAFSYASIAYTTTPTDAIANALSAVRDGGQTTSQDFILHPGSIIKSKNFADDGFGEKDIIFYTKGQFQNYLTTSITENFSYLETKENPIKATATVICGKTSEELNNLLEKSNLEFVKNIEPNDFCENDYACCAVIISEAQEYTLSSRIDWTGIIISIIIIIILLAVPLIAYKKKSIEIVYYLFSLPNLFADISLIASLYYILAYPAIASLGFVLFLEIPLILLIVSLFLRKRLPEPKWKMLALVFTYVNVFFIWLIYFVIIVTAITPLY